jgi:signal transduction histidine kinase/sugar lactone lactonase YvrE
MEVYGTDEGLRDLSVWEVKEDSEGRLWVASNAGLVVSEQPLTDYGTSESIRFVTQLDGVNLLDRSVNHNKIAIDSRNTIWVGTDNLGIVRYSYDEAGIFHADTVATNFTDDELEAPVRAVTSDDDGHVWVSLTEGTLLRYNNFGNISSYNTGTEANTNTLFVDSTGTLWGGDQQGRVWRMDKSGSQPEFINLDITVSGSISDLKEDSRGNIWVTSEGDGILKVLGANSESSIKTESIDQTNGLLSNIVFNTFEDRENNIWIAQSGGVSKLRYNYPAFKNITAESYSGEQPLLPGSSVGAVHYSQNSQFPCSLFAGTSQGGVACISDQFATESISQENGLQNNWVNGVETDDTGRVWIGSTRGLSSVSDLKSPIINGVTSSFSIDILGTEGRLSTYDTASILAAENLEIDKNSSQSESVKSLWFPGYHEVYVVSGDRFYIMDASFGLPTVIYHSAAFDAGGYLWLGTRDQGIFRSKDPFTLETLQSGAVSDESVELFEQWWSTENGAPSNQIEKMLWVDGLMWVGTASGLYALDTTLETRHIITSEDGFLANNATSFDYSSVTETLWVGTNRGLSEVDPETGVVLRNVTRQDGLVDNEVWYYGSVEVSIDGTVYYGTAKGVSIYDPSLDFRNEEPPRVVLENVLTEEEQGERNQFTFQYSALSYGNERGLKYQTRLIGFTDEWSQLKSDTRVNYTNLPAIFLPKEYTFEVRAINENNISSGEPARYAFLVSPPVWLKWWAFLIYLIIFSIGVFLVDRFQRVRLLKRERETAHLRETELKADAAIARSKVAEVQAKALQAENDLKVAELEKARELESAYHELKNTQNRLIQAEKMASLGRLSTGIAHEIKNPLNFINNFAEVSSELFDELNTAIEENDTEEVKFILSNLKFNTEKIEEHGKRADSIVRSMMQHSRTGTSDMEETDLNKLIQKYVELAYHGRQVQNKKLDVTVTTDLDETLEPVDLMAQKVGQVLQNLIENAIDSVWSYSKEKGDEFKPTIKIMSKRYQDFVEVRVADNGPGIPEENRERIFEPFFTTKPTGEGTGLGLSISYDIITQMHNGKLEIEESDMGGALFVITLPLSAS